MHHGEIPDNPPSSTIIRVLRQVNAQDGDKPRLHFIYTLNLPYIFQNQYNSYHHNSILFYSDRCEDNILSWRTRDQHSRCQQFTWDGWYTMHIGWACQVWRGWGGASFLRLEEQYCRQFHYHINKRLKSKCLLSLLSYEKNSNCGTYHELDPVSREAVQITGLTWVLMRLKHDWILTHMNWLH